MTSQKGHGKGERRADPPALLLRVGKCVIEQPQYKWQPNCRAQNGQLERWIAGQIAGEGKADTGKKARRAPAG